VRGIIRELGEAGGDITILDLEAGLEHLKRGTPRHTDAILVVAEPYYRSLETATRTAELGRELGIPRVAVVANKVRDEHDDEWIRKVFHPRQVEVIGTVPFDSSVVEADRQPAALIDVEPDAPAVRAVAAVLEALDLGLDHQGNGSQA
jgi:CO dehydrogenase maturation factor